MTENLENKPNGSSEKYLALLSIIEEIQKRLQWSELIYITLNLLVFFPSAFFASNISNRQNHFHVLCILFGFVIGMIINSYWLVSSIRLQLKLKLRYFQARNLERKYHYSDESFISDEDRYFNPQIGMVESFDGKETIYYPKKGMLRMDGFIGSAKPRYLSIMIPSIFFVIYLFSFYSILYSSIQQG